MIDITVDIENGVIEVEQVTYIIDDDLVKFIKDLIDKLKYSGESCILYKAAGEKKRLVKEW